MIYWKHYVYKRLKIYAEFATNNEQIPDECGAYLRHDVLLIGSSICKKEKVMYRHTIERHCKIEAAVIQVYLTSCG